MISEGAKEKPPEFEPESKKKAATRSADSDDDDDPVDALESVLQEDKRLRESREADAVANRMRPLPGESTERNRR